MYERSAIVLERNLGKNLEFEKRSKLKKNFKNFQEIIIETEEYLEAVSVEENAIKEFDEIVALMQKIQKEQAKLYNANIKLEEERNQLFNNYEEAPKDIESKLDKIDNILEKSNDQMKDLKDRYIKNLADFWSKQKERNKYTKQRRLIEAKHLEFIKTVEEDYNAIDKENIKKLKEFTDTPDNPTIKKELNTLMIENGEDEKIGFNKEVIKKAIDARVEIARNEIECYLTVYDRMKKLLEELNNDRVGLKKYQKIEKEMSVKIAILNAQKEYIFNFLDNERMTVINGIRNHNKMQKEACANFDLDMNQIANLYELMLKEISKKATKKDYEELYNKTYLKEIEEKEKKFNEQVNNIKIKAGTIINQNYWRIEGIKNIYEVFQEEISKKFDKDMSEYQIEEYHEEIDEDEIEEEVEVKVIPKKRKTRTKKVVELIEDEEEDYDDLKNEFEDEEEYVNLFEDDEEDSYYNEDESDEESEDENDFDTDYTDDFDFDFNEDDLKYDEDDLEYDDKDDEDIIINPTEFKHDTTWGDEWVENDEKKVKKSQTKKSKKEENKGLFKGFFKDNKKGNKKLKY